MTWRPDVEPQLSVFPCAAPLGLVLTAKQRGQISSARELLYQLRQAGMYLSDRVLNEALAKVGE